MVDPLYLFPQDITFVDRSNERRAALVSISDQYFLDWLRAPKGMRIESVAMDHTTGVIRCVVTHPQLGPLVDGEMLPELSPSYSRHADRWVIADWGSLGEVADCHDLG